MPGAEILRIYWLILMKISSIFILNEGKTLNLLLYSDSYLTAFPIIFMCTFKEWNPI